jgi:nicotinate-nucleotide adenylyltransferase
MAHSGGGNNQDGLSSGRQGRTQFCVLGGSFDPPHFGHLELALATGKAVGAAEVVLMVAGQSPGKHGPVAAAEHRLAMAGLLALEGTARGGVRLRVDARETLRDGPSYTAETVGELLAEAPGAAITLVVGADQLAQLGTWRRAEWLAEHVQFAVAMRGDVPGGLAGLIAGFPAELACKVRAVEVAMRPNPVSSSQIRGMVARGESIAGLLPDSVADYIRLHGLYCGT